VNLAQVEATGHSTAKDSVMFGDHVLTASWAFTSNNIM